MSVQAMSQVWGADFPDQAQGVGRAAVRLVALAVADTVSDVYGNEFWAALATVAAKTGLSRDTVRAALQHLTDAGVMTVLATAPGQPVRYRWTYTPTDGPHTPRRGDPTPPQGDDPTPPRGDDPAPGNGTPPPNPKGSQQGPQADPNGSTLSLSTAEAMTPGQRAKVVLDRYWAWCRQTYGRSPDIPAVAFQRIVTGLITEGIGERPIQDAVKALHQRGRPITRATIGAQIDGRGTGPAARQDVAAAVDAMRFDAEGRLV